MDRDEKLNLILNTSSLHPEVSDAKRDASVSFSTRAGCKRNTQVLMAPRVNRARAACGR